MSCVPGVGLFMFFEDRLNFTDARLSCQKLNGTLAHVVSEERTEGLANFVGNTPTYVGLSSQGEKRIWKNEFGIKKKNIFYFKSKVSKLSNLKLTYNLFCTINFFPGESLECFDYRAWGEGEPTNSRGCVVLFRKNVKAIPIWRVSPCNLAFPYVCEIPPAKVRKHHKKNKHSN